MQEGLLKINAAPDKIRLMTKNQRRNQGIYYTPVAIARYIARKSIDALISDGHDPIERISVVDPSCGEGVFLVETAKYIQEKMQGFAGTKALSPIINGVDVDTEALQKARDALIMISRSNGTFADAMITDLVEKNALFDEIYRDSSYDLVIGNPPYISWNRIPRGERITLECGKYIDARFTCRPNHADAQPNYYLFFIVRAASLLKLNGIISFLLPQEWLYHERAKDFRNYILDHFGKIDITVFKSDDKLFKEPGAIAGTTSMILTLHKQGNNVLAVRVLDTRLDGVELDAIDDREVMEIPFSKARNISWIFLDTAKEAIRSLILKQDVAFFNDDSYFNVKGGFQPPVMAAKAFEIDEEQYCSLPANERDHVFPLVHDACEISPYIVTPKSLRFWVLVNDFEAETRFSSECPMLHALLKSRLDTTHPRWWCFPNIRNFGLIKATREKILAPRTASTPSFALDESRSVFKGTNTMIVSKRFPARYILGILNSKLSAIWQEMVGFQYHGSATRKNEPSKAKKTLIPIKKPRPSDLNEIVDLVDKMLGALGNRINNDLDEIKAIQACIDSAVFRLYGIDKKILATIKTNDT